MATVEVVHTITPSARAVIDQFLESAACGECEGAPCERLGDHLLLDFRHGPRPGFVAALAADGDRLVGYAQASTSAGGHVVDSVVAAGSSSTLEPELLRALLHALPATGSVTWWAHDDDEHVAADLGLAPGRRLLEMRVALPLAQRRHTVVPTRPFRVGIDEHAWLDVNNAAFSWHDEQGGWDLTLLEQREQEPWFDPAGFLVHDIDNEMAGFCWTKVHDGSPTIGEIYVIAVHPRHRGTGLGRSLVVAGIEHLTAAGARECMLYVDATNTAAVTLYEDLGFRTVHAEQAFTRRDSLSTTTSGAST